GQHGYWASLRIEPDLISQIKEAQKEDSEIWTIVENLNKQVEFRLDDDNVLWQDTRLVVPNDATLREALLTEAHSSLFSVHPGLPQTQRRHDAIWVVVDRLTKSAHFLPIRKDFSVSRLAEIFQQEIVRLHGTPSAIVSDRDPRFASRFWKGLQKAWGTRLKFSTAFHPQTDGQSERTIQTLEDMLRSCALEWTGNWDDYICLVEFAYNNSWHASIKCAPFEMLYGRKCRAPICWDQPGDHVFLKVSPGHGVRRFGIKGKLSPRFIGPFEILDRVGEVSYRLALPPQLSHVHDVFHVSLLRGYKYHPLHVITRHDAIWVVVDRLTKSAHFLPIRKDYSVSRLAEIFQQEIVRIHGTPSAIVSDRDPRFASRFLERLTESLGNQAQVQYCLSSPDRRPERAYYSDTGGHVTFMCLRVDRQLG
nr:putative nucleotidyltransferase, ribonuclease H [Tanacetum cinerariifolium]